ncbi:MAG: hypothetical protein IPN15_22570 [Saprospiraceae bacterium]|nr:hypothetical protein [Candidatus Vicinibacter affinis]
MNLIKRSNFGFEKKITIAQLEKQNILSEKQRQDLKIKDQLIIISNAKNKISHLAYLKEKSEKAEKENQLQLSEKDKQLQVSQLNILNNEKKNTATTFSQSKINHWVLTRRFNCDSIKFNYILSLVTTPAISKRSYHTIQIYTTAFRIN